MRAEVFVPGHITGFFEVFENPDPLKAGSRGCGVVLSKGTLTRVEAEEARRSSMEVYVNDAPCDCPVTRSVIARITRLAGEKYSVHVEHLLELPMKYGLGVSAAGALGTALALNKALELGLSRDACGRIAHEAEVRNRTGLGDVIAELAGGLVLRTKPGAPGIGRVEKIPSDYEVVVFLVGKELETKKVLLNKDKKEKINTAGKKSYEAFIREKTPENFLKASLRFAREAELMDEKVYLAAASLANHGVTSSMAMLGNALFTLTREPSKIIGLLDYPCFTARINDKGARV
jgi:pantoate kinase